MPQQPELEVLRQPTRTALVVEPAPAMAKLLSRMIRDLGFDVIQATGPAEALAEFEYHAPQIDLVVCELSLAEVSGSRVASFITQRRPDIPIVLLCDHVVPLPTAVAARAAFLNKPFSPAQLAGTIQGFTPSMSCTA